VELKSELTHSRAVLRSSGITEVEKEKKSGK
jgi:hypothetical protein